MTRPIQPPIRPNTCPRCGAPCLGHILTGECASCSASAARLALERGAAGRTAPVVDAGAAVTE